VTSSFGKLFTLTVFGESHGRCVGVVVDGCPAGLPLGEADIQPDLDKRRAKPAAASTGRLEEDKPEILSGVLTGIRPALPFVSLSGTAMLPPAIMKKTDFYPAPATPIYRFYEIWRI